MRVPPRLLLFCVSCCLPTLSFGQAVSLAAASSRGPSRIRAAAARRCLHRFRRLLRQRDHHRCRYRRGDQRRLRNREHHRQPQRRHRARHQQRLRSGRVRANLPTIDGLNTIATFDGAFVAEAGATVNGDFRFTMIGNDPKLGGATVYPANIDEVSLQLLNADGSVFNTVPFAPFEQKTPQLTGLRSLRTTAPATTSSMPTPCTAPSSSTA